MKISSYNIYKLLLLLALGFYMSLIGFGEGLLLGSERGLDNSKSGNIINQITGLTLLGLSILIVTGNKSFKLYQTLKTTWPLWLLLGFFFLSFFWSHAPSISLRRLVALSTMIATCYVLVKLFSPQSLLTLVSNVIVLSVFLGLLVTVLTNKELAFGLSERAAGFRGIFGDKNGAARVYTYGFLIMLGLGRYKTKLDVLFISMLLLAIALSQSATAVVMLFLGTGLIFIFNLFKGKNAQNNLLRFVTLVLLLLLTTALVSLAYEYILGLLGRDPSLTNRSIIWALIDPLIDKNSFLGYGYGAFWVSDGATPFIERWGFIGNAHSGYKEAMLHGGYVGLCLLIILLAFHTIKAIRLHVSPNHGDISSLLLALIIVQSIVNYIAYIVLNYNSVDMFLYLICFFICCNTEEQLKGKSFRHAE